MGDEIFGLVLLILMCFFGFPVLIVLFSAGWEWIEERIKNRKRKKDESLD
jgi:hypothetical protein